MNGIEYGPNKPSRLFGVERLLPDSWPKRAREVLTGPLLQGKTGQPLTTEEILQLPSGEVDNISIALNLKVQERIGGFEVRYRVTRPAPFGQLRIMSTRADNHWVALQMAIAKLREDVLLRQRQQQSIVEDS